MAAAVTVGAQGASTRLRYRDPGSGYQVVVTTPAVDELLWRDYLAGAAHSYRVHDVENALELDRMRDGRSTSLLFVVVSPDDVAVAGLRVQGPYTAPDQAHAVHEWQGHPDQSTVATTFARRIPFGVVELKAAWVAEECPQRRALVACLCRTPLHAAALLGARYAMGTAAAHAVPGWTAAGGVVDRAVAPASYPDPRYRTRLVWWDRWALHTSAITDVERRAVDDETRQLGTTAPPAVPGPSGLPAQTARS